MKTIYKYRIPMLDSFTIAMPKGAKVLHFSIDQKDGLMYVWAEINTYNGLVHKGFELIGTGNPIMSVIKKYIGTVQKDGFVWHLFEIL
jgi:hypothetical protein